MKKISVLIILLFSAQVISAQYHRLKDFGKSNGIYIETQAGRYEFNTSFASLNYERYFGRFKSVSLRVGGFITKEPELLMPLSVQYIMNSRNPHRLELGFGALYHVKFEDTFSGDMPGLLMPLAYRYQESDKFYIRFGLNFLAGNYLATKLFFSLGHRF